MPEVKFDYAFIYVSIKDYNLITIKTLNLFKIHFMEFLNFY